MSAKRARSAPRKLAQRSGRIPLRVLTKMTEEPWALRSGKLEAYISIANRQGLGAVANEFLREDPEICTMTIRQGVAVIPVIGPTFRYASMMHELCGGTSYDAIARDFNAAVNDAAVKAILFEINSPGGEVTGCDQTSRMIRDARGKKPIVAYIDGDGCSAAYWLASACDFIAADTTAQVGSIGVVGVFTDTKIADEKAGIRNYEIVSSQSPNKRPDVTTDEGRAQLERIIDATANVFVDTVAINRGVTVDDVLKRFGQGGCFVGADAVKAGLVDEIASFEEVFSTLVENAGDAGLSVARTPSTPVAQTTKTGARRAASKDGTMAVRKLRSALKKSGKSASRKTASTRATARRAAEETEEQKDARRKSKARAKKAEVDEDEEVADENEDELDQGADEGDEDEVAEDDELDENADEGEDDEVAEDEDEVADEGEDDEVAEDDDEVAEDDEEEPVARRRSKKAGKKATGERGRIQAILTSNAARGREDLAHWFAFETNMSPRMALAGLKLAPRAGGPASASATPRSARGDAWRAAMANNRGPKINGSRGTGRRDQDLSGEDAGAAAAAFAQKMGMIPGKAR